MKPGHALREELYQLEGHCHLALDTLEATRENRDSEFELPSTLCRLEGALKTERIQTMLMSDREEAAKLSVRRWAKQCFTPDARYPIELSEAFAQYERWAQREDYASCQLTFPQRTPPFTREEERERALWLFEQGLRSAGITSHESMTKKGARAIWGVIRVEGASAPVTRETVNSIPIVDRRSLKSDLLPGFENRAVKKRAVRRLSQTDSAKRSRKWRLARRRAEARAEA